MFTDALQSFDPEVFAACDREMQRQQHNIELIASENIVSKAVLLAAGSVLTNKYAEGYPGKRYYGGCVYVDEVEEIARERAKKLFGAEHANVQPHSGANANLAAFFALLQPGDTVGYGAGWRAKRPTKIAVLSIGWYHGFGAEKGRDLFRIRDCIREILHNLRWIFTGKRLHVCVNGALCSVLGHVGMVNTIVDVTDVDCKIGDLAVLQVNPLQVKGMKILYR